MSDRSRPPVLAWILGAAFVGIGIRHFTHPALFERIVPAAFPAHAALVRISGVCEIAGGLGLVVPATRRAAGYGLLALLVAVFPANVNMALNAPAYADIAPAWVLWARLPFQPLFMWLVGRASRRSR